MKKLIFFLLLASLVLSKSYSIPNSKVTFDIKSNGSVYVTEEIEYQLDGCFKELYLEKPNDLPILGAHGRCIGANCNFRVDEPHDSVSKHRELILELKSNNCNSNVAAVFNYEIRVVKRFKDGNQFFQKLWGEWWEKGTQLTAIVKMPGDNGYEYFIHPWGTQYQEQKIGNTLIFVTNQPEKTFFEINLVMPKHWFGNGEFIQENYSRDDIAALEINEKNRWEIERIIKGIICLISSILLIMPAFLIGYVYYKYGKEDDLNYFAEYERDLPSDDTPGQVNALVNNFNMNMDAFIGTILALVNKKMLSMRSETIKRKLLFIEKNDEEIIFKITPSGKEIAKDEDAVLALIKKYASGNEISFSELKSKISKDYSFASWLERWKSGLENESGKYIHFEGPNKYLGYSLICFGAIFGMVLITTILNMADDLMAVLWMIAFFGLIIGNVIAWGAKGFLGKWKPEGRLKQQKWLNFKKYISDFSLLKEHPPESIALWDKYLVYAVALGVGEKTIKAMSIIVPKYDGTFAVFYHSPRAYTGFTTGFTNSIHTSTNKGGGGGFGGGMGGSGGGGGGGGGGAR